jgi:hypothetical protein
MEHDIAGHGIEQLGVDVLDHDRAVMISTFLHHNLDEASRKALCGLIEEAIVAVVRGWAAS